MATPQPDVGTGWPEPAIDSSLWDGSPVSEPVRVPRPRGPAAEMYLAVSAGVVRAQERAREIGAATRNARQAATRAGATPAVDLSRSPRPKLTKPATTKPTGAEPAAAPAAPAPAIEPDAQPQPPAAANRGVAADKAPD